MVTILQSSDQSLISFAAPPGARSQRINEGHEGNDLPPRHREHGLQKKSGNSRLPMQRSPSAGTVEVKVSSVVVRSQLCLPLRSAADATSRFWQGDIAAVAIHEFIQRASDRIAETSLVKAVLHMFADPLKKRLAKNLQFFTTSDRRLSIEPFKLLRGESIHDRGIDFVSLFFPKGMCLVAVGHLVKILVILPAFG